MKLILASNNAKKLKELKAILSDMDVEILSQREAGCNFEVDETGTTFAENAYLKAKAVFDATGEATVADDSGLMVDALNGEPGVYSARYAGELYNNVANIQLLRKKMQNITDREAYMQTVLVLMNPDGTYYYGEGTVQGSITRARRGYNGFGYDSVFYCPLIKKTFGEATFVEKQSVSHRLRAVNDLMEKIRTDKILKT